eukprot:GHVH01006012.1.p3 GENE.GHVH01006012.1~~GHVH01006012.1.p3  ORF type:complete len:115 (+),score=14.98 GHVH01006012.1:227-571(+)
MTEIDKQLTYRKWDKFPIGNSFAVLATVAASLGSLLFGFSLGVLNSSLVWISAELYPCSVDGSDGWSKLELSEACLDILHDGTDISICNAGVSPDDLDPLVRSRCYIDYWMFFV